MKIQIHILYILYFDFFYLGGGGGHALGPSIATIRSPNSSPIPTPLLKRIKDITYVQHVLYFTKQMKRGEKKKGDSSLLPLFCKKFGNMPVFPNYLGPCPTLKLHFL